MTIRAGDTVRFTEQGRIKGGDLADHEVLAVNGNYVRLDSGTWIVWALEKVDATTFDYIGTLALSRYDPYASNYGEDSYSVTEGPEVVSCSSCGAVVLSSMKEQHTH